MMHHIVGATMIVTVAVTSLTIEKFKEKLVDVSPPVTTYVMLTTVVKDAPPDRNLWQGRTFSDVQSCQAALGNLNDVLADAVNPAVTEPVKPSGIDDRLLNDVMGYAVWLYAQFGSVPAMHVDCITPSNPA